MKISKEVYDALVEWGKEHANIIEIGEFNLIDPHEVTYLDTIVGDWWLDSTISNAESNNRLIAIIRWVNGEDVFEIEKPTKWVVRSKEKDSVGDYWYIQLTQDKKFSDGVCDLFGATKFDTKEEAESWANSHQEVIEVEE